MFIANKNLTNKIYNSINKNSKIDFKKILQENKSHLKWLNIKFGQILFFNSNFFHGNDVNKEKQTRFSLNTRFKSFYSPYTSDEKHLDNFYEPITIKAATKAAIKIDKL